MRVVSHRSAGVIFVRYVVVLLLTISRDYNAARLRNQAQARVQFPFEAVEDRPDYPK